MTPSRLSIGELSRAAGLSVSALRFYDRQGLLIPDEVAERSGYRWYAPEQLDDARLLAALRRVGLPLSEMGALLADRRQAAEILAEHVRRLEEGLAAARAEVSLIRERWNGPEGGDPATPGRPEARHEAGGVGAGATVVVTAGELATGLRTVRHAVGTDPDMPGIHGVLLVAISDALRLAATDRVRGAFAEVPAACTGSLRLLLPTVHADALAVRLEGARPDAELLLTCRGRHLEVRHGVETLIEVEAPETRFPDLSHAIPKARLSADLDGEELRRALAAHPEAKAWWMSPDGRLVPDRAPGPDAAEIPAQPVVSGAVLLDADYLAEALEALRQDDTAGTRAQLRLDLDGPDHPLALRRAEDPGTFAVLLPIRPATSTSS